MTVTRRAEIDLIGFDVGNEAACQGQMAIRWAKLTYDSGRLLARESHRVLLAPGDDIDSVMGMVNTDLAGQGFGSMPLSDIDLVKIQAAAVWTPEIVAAAAAKRAADVAEQSAAAAAMQEREDAQAAEAADAQEQMIAAAIARYLTAKG